MYYKELSNEVQIKSKSEMVKEIMNIFIPAIISSLSVMGVEILNIGFIGHLGDTNLIAAVGMGNMYFNAFGLAVYVGLNNTLVTLVSQSQGQGNMRLCGIYHNRGRIICFLAFIPIGILMIFSREAFILLGQTDTVATLAEEYLMYMFLGMFLNSQFDVTRQFLNAFGLTQIAMYIQIFTTILHALWNYIFITYLDMKLLGTGISLTITCSLNLIISTIYISTLQDLRQSWFLPDRDCFHGLLDYMKLSVYSTLMICLEYWSYELQMLMASFISVVVSSAQIIILNTIFIFSVIALGLSLAGTALIGRSIGAMNIAEAKQYRWIIIRFGFGLSISLSLLLYFGRGLIIKMFTNIEEVIVVIDNTLTIVGFAVMFDTLQAWNSGVIRGLGKFSYASIGQLVAFYFISIPLGYTIGIHYGYGLNGLWSGMLVGLVLLSCYYFYLSNFHFNWESIAQEAYDRQIYEVGKLQNKKVVDDPNIIKDLKEPLIKSIE